MKASHWTGVKRICARILNFLKLSQYSEQSLHGQQRSANFWRRLNGNVTKYTHGCSLLISNPSLVRLRCPHTQFPLALLILCERIPKASFKHFLLLPPINITRSYLVKGVTDFPDNCLPIQQKARLFWKILVCFKKLGCFVKYLFVVKTSYLLKSSTVTSIRMR